MNGASVWKSPGAAVTAVLAVVYGLGVAFLELEPMAKQWWLLGGAAIVGVLFVVFIVVPLVRGLLAGNR